MTATSHSRETILQCALQLFADRGYASVSVNEICQQAGITKPTLYYFFGSKEGVFGAILHEHYSRLNQALRHICRYDPHPQDYEHDVFPALVAVATSYFNFARANPTFYLLLLSLALAPPSAPIFTMAKPYAREQYETIATLFHEISAAHGNLAGHEEDCTRHFIALINADVAAWHHEEGPIDENQAKQLVHQFMHGIFA